MGFNHMVIIRRIYMYIIKILSVCLYHNSAKMAHHSKVLILAIYFKSSHLKNKVLNKYKETLIEDKFGILLISCKSDLSCYNMEHSRFIYCLWGLKYADCVPIQRGKTTLPRSVLGMTKNCIWWWGSSFGTLECFNTAITLRSTLTQNGSTY